MKTPKTPRNAPIMSAQFEAGFCIKCGKQHRRDSDFCSDSCNKWWRRKREDVRNGYGEAIEANDLIHFLEATSLKDLKISGAFIPNWRGTSLKLKKAESELVKLIGQFKGSLWSYKGMDISI